MGESGSAWSREASGTGWDWLAVGLGEQMKGRLRSFAAQG